MNNNIDLNVYQVEDVEVRTLWQKLNEAWGNADAYADLFTNDASYIAFDGSRAQGRREIAESHRPLFEGILHSSRLVGEILEIRFLAPNVALIHSKGAVLQKRQQQPSRRAMSIQTTVVVKQDGRWLISAFQNTRYRPWNETLLGKVLVHMNERRVARKQKTDALGQ